MVKSSQSVESVRPSGGQVCPESFRGAAPPNQDVKLKIKKLLH